MSKKELGKVRGVQMFEVALDTQAFNLSGNVFYTYELFGRRLRRNGFIIAEGVASSRDAVLWGLAWESCLAEAKRLHAMTVEKLDSLLQRSEEYVTAMKERIKSDEFSKQPGLANDSSPSRDGGQAEATGEGA